MRTKYYLFIFAILSTIITYGQKPQKNDCIETYKNSYLYFINDYSKCVIKNPENSHSVIPNVKKAFWEKHSVVKNDLEFLYNYVTTKNEESQNIDSIGGYLSRINNIINNKIINKNTTFIELKFDYDPINSFGDDKSTSNHYNSAANYNVKEYMIVSWQKNGETKVHNDTIVTVKTYTFFDSIGAVRIKKVKTLTPPTLKVADNNKKGSDHVEPRKPFRYFPESLDPVEGFNFSWVIGEKNAWEIGLYRSGTYLRWGFELVKPFRSGYYEYYPNAIEGHFSMLKYTPQKNDIGYMASVGFFLPTRRNPFIYDVLRVAISIGGGVGCYDYMGRGNGYDNYTAIFKGSLFADICFDDFNLQFELAYLHSSSEVFKGLVLGIGLGFYY